MKKTLLIATVFLLGGVSMSFAKDIKKEDLKDEKSKMSYILGYDVGKSLKGIPEVIDMELVAQGMADSYNSKKELFTMDEMNSFKQEYFTKLQQKESQINADAGKKFLENNKANSNVKTTASGLQYEVVKQGTGKSPKATDTVTVNYRGTLIDGEEFDSSYKRGQPASFPVNGVIKGWVEGLQLMKEGDVFKFYIPSELAYGERGAGGLIGPNMALIFEVELIEVKSK